MRAELSATQDQFFASLARAAGDAALAWHAGLAARMSAAVGATFAAAHRMVDRVHRLGARVRPNAAMTRAPGFAKADVDIIEIAELADRRAAFALHAAHFTAGENDHRPFAFFRAHSCDHARRANEFSALAGVHFDVMDFQTAGNIG